MKFYLYVSQVLLSLSLVSCLSERPKGRFVTSFAGAGASLSVKTYARTVYPLLRENCKECHETHQAPLHAVESPEESHNTIIKTGKVDFNIATNSRLYIKLKNEQHNCWGNCDDNAEIMKNMIEKWLPVIDKGIATPDGIKTDSIDISLGEDIGIPADPSSPGSVTRMIRRVPFQLEVKGSIVKFTIDVEDVPNQNYYKLYSLNMENGHKNMIIKTVNILINETFDPNATAFVTISDVIPASQSKDLTGGESGTVLFLKKEYGMEQDKIQLSFEVLHPYDEI